MFKQAYNISRPSMRSLVREHAASLKLKGNKRTKKFETRAQEVGLYKKMERKRNGTFEGMAKFCTVTTGLERPKWDNNFTRAEVREDRRGCSFALIDFRSIPGASSRGTKDLPFYNPFMAKFMEYKSPAMREPHVWLWIVEQERVSDKLELYEKTTKFKYNIYHNTYIPAKTERIVIINEARGNKQVGAVSLVFLTFNHLRDEKAPIKAISNSRRSTTSRIHLPRIYSRRRYLLSSSRLNSGWNSTSQFCRVWRDGVQRIWGQQVFVRCHGKHILIGLRTLVCNVHWFISPSNTGIAYEA